MSLFLRIKNIRSSSRKKQHLLVMILFLIFLSTLSTTLQVDPNNYNDILTEKTSGSLFRDKNTKEDPIFPTSSPSFAVQSFQDPEIMFIVGESTNLNPDFDQPFFNFMNSTLNYTVICHDDNNSYSYEKYDAIVISDSISVDQVSSLENATIPILIMEAFTYSVFHLASGRGGFSGDSIYIMNSNHNITLKETNDTSISVYNSTGEINFLKGTEFSTTDIVSLARRTVQHVNERTLIALDKGKEGYDNHIASERRAFWGFTQGSVLNQHGWDLWNRTLRWILYDYQPSYATITVNVKDEAKWNVPNARVNLTNALDVNQEVTQNTTLEGQTIFSNIPFGTYNITVEFEDSINYTLSSLDIVSEHTYQSTVDISFTIIMVDEFVDNDPPIITEIGFWPSNKTFHANVTDANDILSVNISLTISNSSHTIPVNYSMATTDGMIFFNSTAAQDLIAVNITYNITAIDIAGNSQTSDNYQFLLGDITAPIIYEYNVTDFSNGSLLFYANVTDKHSLVDEVILKINSSQEERYEEMTLDHDSGYWIYKTDAYYGLLLNYSLYSAKDSVGNFNNTPTIAFGSITPNDTIPPDIYGVTYTFDAHESGYVEFTVYIEDWNDYQSGVNNSNVQIHFSIRKDSSSWDNRSFLMSAIGEITFHYSYTFAFNDTIWFNISVSDLAGNKNQSYVHGPYVIDDNIKPQVTFGAREFGNGTVEFNSTVIDWPKNATTVTVYYSYDQEEWNQSSMERITDIVYIQQIEHLDYHRQDVWYYITANDTFNLFEPSPDQYMKIRLTDTVPPLVMFTVEYTRNDGEIQVSAYATDEFGTPAGYVDNIFYINMSQEVVNTPMDYDGFYLYTLTHTFQYGDEVTITVWVQDDAGNFGSADRTLTIDDFAPPKIEDHNSTVYQNGTVYIWAEVIEGSYGSGLAEDNSSVTLEYTYGDIAENVIMLPNGSEDYFSFSIAGIEPGIPFFYKIQAIDNNNNLNETVWNRVPILDLTPPIYLTFDYLEELINHTSSIFYFWVEVDDPFGTVAGVNISLNHLYGYQWSNYTQEMSYDGSHYFYSINLTLNSSFRYSLQIFDESSNINETPIICCETHDFLPTTAMDYGMQFNIPELNLGEFRFWIRINDTFEEHPFNEHYIKLSVFDETLGSEILNEELMESNGTHHIFHFSIDYLHYFSYIMQVNDAGVLGGYYEPQEYTNFSQMLDYWRPVIHSNGINKINETTIVIWANISDWGSEDTDVFLRYEFNRSENGGGAGSQVHEIPMDFKDGLYTIELAFSESGTLYWFIIAYDSIGSSISSQNDYSFFIQIDTLNLFDLLLQMVPIILSTAVIFIVALYGTVTYRKKRSVQYQRTKETQDQLSIISNVYTILVSTEVGVPILNVMNILYQKDESLNDALSGLSVGIDIFLQSFQSDFMQQVQHQSLEFPTDIESHDNIRMSVIEQHQIQILIVASQKYRIFVFLGKKPSNFTKNAFYKAINDFERSIHIPHLGVVDDSLFGPQIEAIIKKYFPITLLMPFVIDTRQLNRIDNELKKGMKSSPISREGINAIKRLAITKTSSKVNGKHPQVEIKLFDENMKKGLLKDTKALLFNDARKIMTKLLKIPPEQVYEALWTGSSPDVKIIVPYRDIDQ